MLTSRRIGWVIALTFVFASQAADLSRLRAVSKVYLWPMSHALDQYLAEQMAAEGVFEIVVDPKLASAIMTEKIDSTFLQALEELFPPLEPGEAEAKTEKTQDDESLESNFRMQRPSNHPKARPHGTLFLVDRHSRQVIWSTYLKEFDPSPNELHKQASAVVEKLKSQIEPGS